MTKAMTLLEEAALAEKIRTAFHQFIDQCAEDVDILAALRKVDVELSSLSFALKKINRLIDLDEGKALPLIIEDLKAVHEEITFTLKDVWDSFGKLGNTARTSRDYRAAWREINSRSWENNGRSLQSALEDFRVFVESLSKTVESNVVSPTVERLRPDIQSMYARRSPRPNTQPSRPTTPKVERRASTKRNQRPSISRAESTKQRIPVPLHDIKQPKSYERERPMSPDDSEVSSGSNATRFRDRFNMPSSPPVSPAATISSISQISSTAPSLETSSTHWAKQVFQNVSSTPLPWSSEETRYHPSPGSKELEYPKEDYEAVLNIAYPEGVRVSLLCRATDYRSKVVVYYRDSKGRSEYSCLLLRDLFIKREGPLLRICRTKSSGKPIPWITMKFTTVERLVLFSGTFIAMRSQDSSVRGAVPNVHDADLKDEEVEYGGKIIDGGFNHGLRIYRDRLSDAVRIQASVRKGELDRTPVWTAFITHTLASRDWLRRINDRTITLADIKLHIFSSRYTPYHTPSGAFLLRFESKEDADGFEDILYDLANDQ